MVRLIAVVLFAGLAAGCAATPSLSPLPGAQPAPPGPGRGASDTVEGVTVVARSQAWAGVPRQLDVVTPVQVTIENRSDQPLRVRYEQFSLVGPAQRYQAIPPFDVRGTETERVSNYVRSPAARSFSPYRPYRPFRARGFYPYDDFYYPGFGPAFVEIELPTGDMIQKALPEDVLMPGDRMTGFLYFQRVDRRAGRVDFRMELVDANTGERRGTISIPFEVD